MSQERNLWRRFVNSRVGECIVLGPYFVCLSPFAVFACLYEYYQSSKFGRTKFQEKQITPPRPVKRKRALTLPLKVKSRIETSDQSDSGFFRLPAEIRDMVYKEYVGEEILVRLDVRRLCANRLRSDETKRIVAGQADVIPLLQSCRRIYSEAISVLYASPTFTFQDAPAFLAFYSTILPQRSNCITRCEFDFTSRNQIDYSIANCTLYYYYIKSQCQTRNLLPHPSLAENATFWCATCKVLEGMRNLKKLDVVTNSKRFYNWYLSVEKELRCHLDPLKQNGVDIDLTIGGYNDMLWIWKVRDGRATNWESIERWKIPWRWIDHMASPDPPSPSNRNPRIRDYSDQHPLN